MIGRLDRNPLIGALRLDGDGERDVVISTAEDYATLFDTMDKMVAAGELRDLPRTFIVVAALTGMRRGELRSLRWRDINR
jgi:integrase